MGVAAGRRGGPSGRSAGREPQAAGAGPRAAGFSGCLIVRSRTPARAGQAAGLVRGRGNPLAGLARIDEYGKGDGWAAGPERERIWGQHPASVQALSIL